MIRVFLTMWNRPSEHIVCNKLLIEEGAKIDVDGEEMQMLAVIASDKIYHPVVSVEVF